MRFLLMAFISVRKFPCIPSLLRVKAWVKRFLTSGHTTSKIYLFIYLAHYFGHIPFYLCESIFCVVINQLTDFLDWFGKSLTSNLKSPSSGLLLEAQR